MKERMLGYEVEIQSLGEFANRLFNEIFQPGNQHIPARWLACFNPHSYAVSKRDRAFFNALKAADWLVPDGAGVLLASKLLGGRISERITGSDVFAFMHQRMNEQSGHSVFFLGSTEDTLAQIRARMARDYPNIRVVGTYSPPFKSSWSDSEQDDMVNAINTAKPDVLWVGLTAPKQEKWIHDNLPRLNIRFAAAVGAVFDFYTGKVKRSHPLFQRLGLEWLPRLFQQPRRLWRRMFVSAPVFLWDVLTQRSAK